PETAPLATTAADFVRWAFTASDAAAAAFDRSRKAMNSYKPIDPGWTIELKGRYREARTLAATSPERGPAPAAGFLIARGVGEAPARAMIQGRVNLLLKDRTAAAQDGRAVLAFVSGERESKYNKWFLRILTATGRLFLGDNVGAIQGAREAVALT